MENVTFIIKTFERLYCLVRLVKSILRKYPNAIILIADDSNKSCKEIIGRLNLSDRIIVYELDPDSGLSAGRNYLVDRVETEFFVLLDDDFVFDEKTNIKRALEIVKEKELDILGGYIRNYAEINSFFSLLKCLFQTIIKYEKPANYIGNINFDINTKTLHVNYFRKQFPVYTSTDLVMNFFVAKTYSIRNINRWDDDLKLQEHTAFFYSAKKKGLKVGFSNEFSVQHKPIKTKHYSDFRGRNFVKAFMKKNDIKKIIASYDNGETVITEYEKL